MNLDKKLGLKIPILKNSREHHWGGTWIKFQHLLYCWCWCLHAGSEEVKGWKETLQLVICFHSLLKQSFCKSLRVKLIP